MLKRSFKRAGEALNRSPSKRRP